MKKVTMFYLKNCPFCKKAFRFIDELKAEDASYVDVEIDMIEEDESPEVIANYDYQFVPCFYFGSDKAFEAYSMIPDGALREGVKGVFDEALKLK